MKISNTDSSILLVQVLGIVLLFSMMWFVMFFPFAIPNKLFISFILGLLLYSFFEYCFLPDTTFLLKVKSLSAGRGCFNYFFILSYIFSLVMIATQLGTSTSLLYLSGSPLNLLNVAGLLASIMLTSFLPGYVMVEIVTNVLESHQPVFSKLGVGVLSVLLSFFVTSLTTYLHWVVERGFEGLNYSLFFSYASLFILFIFLRLWMQTKPKTLTKCDTSGVSLKSFYKALVLLSICAFLIWVYFSTHFVPQTTYILYDELDHAGLAQQILKGWQPWQASEVGSAFSYPCFFHLSLIAATSLSNFTLVNTYLSFFFLLILPAFAFYFMVRMVYGNGGKIPLFATVIFSTFSGFGWIYTCCTQGAMIGTSEVSLISQVSQRTYDLIYSTWLPIYIAPYVVDLSIFFVLIGLMGCKQINSKILFILTVPLVSLGVLVHVEKMLILALLLFALSLLYILNVAKYINHTKTMLLSYIIGLLMFYTLDFLAPLKIGLNESSKVQYALLLCLMGLFLVVISEKLHKTYRLSLKFNWRHVKYGLACFAFASYLILSVAFFYSSSLYTFDEQSVPLWFFPLKAGIAGLLSLFGLFFSARERNKIDFFVTLCVLALLMQLLLYHLPFSLVSVNIPEFRVFRDVFWAFLSVVAAYGLKKLIETLRKRLSSRIMLKYFLVCLLFFTIFACSIPSHLLKTEYFASSQQVISAEEMEALNYLSSINIPSGAFILTGFSQNEVYAVTGVQALSLYDPVFAPLIFNSKSPGINLWILYYLNISYIYTNTQDLQFLRNKYSNSFLTWLTLHLPVLFRNNAATVYMVPPFSPPVETSSVGIVTGDLLPYNSTLTKAFVWVDDDFAEGWKKLSANNVEYWNFTSDNKIATLEAKTIQGQQAAVFYTKDLQEYIPTSNDTMAIVKFRSNADASYAVVDILYSDGSEQRLELESKGYMRSLEWIAVGNFLQAKSLKGIRIGMTDDKRGNGKSISCSFDYVAIAKASNPTNYYQPSLLAALTQINYTTVSELDSSILGYKSIFINDLNDTQTSQYINWVMKGGTLVVINSKGLGVFSDFLGITAGTKQLLADSIVDYEGSHLKIPETTISELQLHDNSTTIIADYSFENASVCPFAILKNLEEGKILYLKIDPILENLEQGQNLIETMTWLRDLLEKHVEFISFNSSTYTRTFYVKNIGRIFLEGETFIETPNIILSSEKLKEATVIFSSYSLTENAELTLENITVSAELYGTIPMTIQVNGSSTVSPVDSYDYTSLKFSGQATLRLDISSNSEVTLKSDNGTDFHFCDGVLSLHLQTAEDVELVARNLTITNNGATIFASLFASYPYTFQSSGCAGTFDGHLEFRVKLAEESVLLLDEVKFDGTLYLSTASSTLNDDLIFFINFPKESVLLTSAIILSMVFVYIKVRKKEVATHA